MPYLKPQDARSTITDMNNVLEHQKNSILKQLSQMDMENNSVQLEIEDIVHKMTRTIDDMKSELNSFHFE